VIVVPPTHTGNAVPIARARRRDLAIPEIRNRQTASVAEPQLEACRQPVLPALRSAVTLAISETRSGLHRLPDSRHLIGSNWPRPPLAASPMSQNG
jgi:hypothetical protein